MGLTDSLVQIGNSMAAQKLSVGLYTGLMSKAMDTTKTQAAGLMEMLNEPPVFPGDPGSLFNALA